MAVITVSGSLAQSLSWLVSEAVGSISGALRQGEKLIRRERLPRNLTS